jgi:RNA polymerase sigma-70 factor (ECF subfamily)
VALRREFTRLHDDVDLERDRALVERCQAGDSGAFGSLYARYYERLLRFCLRRLHDRHEAEDATQEAFARAWKALPNFAGERHFYPWLTVIAGNVCTDTLRRRSRSTPTADTELGGRLPVGAAGNPTADEVIIASVDGELVHKALDQLSSRHRDVLAMREGSGMTYQQIADHEGVEIGTIETLLWRARQALKREFNVLAEAKGALAGFLIGSGALIRSGLTRTAHRGAGLASAGGSGSGTVRNAFAGVAVTSAAVAAAFIAPHAFDGAPAGRVALPAATAHTTGDYAARSAVTPDAGSASGGSGTTAVGALSGSNVSAGTGAGGTASPSLGSVGTPLSLGGTSLAPVNGLTGVTQTLHPQDVLQPIAGAVSGGLTQGPVGSAVTSTASGLTNVVGNVVSSAVTSLSTAVTGLGQDLGSTGSATPAVPTVPTVPTLPTPTTTPPTLPAIVAPVASTVTSTVQKLLGSG